VRTDGTGIQYTFQVEQGERGEGEPTITLVNKKTGIFSSSIAEAGQNKGARRLKGWVDIDAFHAEHEPAST
jgi:hypothetical protein